MKNLFDPERSLLSLPVVHWIAGVSMLLAIVFSIPILFACFSMPLSLSGTGINYFALQFKVPLGILALGLALIGLCGANHRSEQTKRQIERTAQQIDLTTQQIKLTSGQNNFSNYFKHLEEFEKHHKAQDSDAVSIKTRRPLHAELFPDARLGIFSLSDEYKYIFEKKINAIIVHWISISQSANSGHYISDISEMLQERDYLSNKFGVKSKNTSGSMHPFKGKHIIIPDNSMSSLYSGVLEVISAVDKLLQFDQYYSSPTSINVLKEAGLLVFSQNSISTGDSFRIPQFEKFTAERIQQ